MSRQNWEHCLSLVFLLFIIFSIMQRRVKNTSLEFLHYSFYFIPTSSNRWYFFKACKLDCVHFSRETTNSAGHSFTERSLVQMDLPPTHRTTALSPSLPSIHIKGCVTRWIPYACLPTVSDYTGATGMSTEIQSEVLHRPTLWP